VNETVIRLSQPYAMQKLLIISVGAILALLGITAFTASRDEPSVSSGVPLLFGSCVTPTVLLAANDSSQPVDSPNPSPGVYRATPYTMVVVVPKPVDNGMVVGVGDISRFKMPRIKPETKLEPLMPPNTALEPTATAPSVSTNK
jgi:hypothetical protein